MITTIYKRALAVLLRKPFALWGISLLNVVLCGLAGVLFGPIPGIALALCLLLEVSMTMIFLHGYHGDEVHVIQLFDCFKDFATVKRVLGGTLWMLLWIFLWALIPLVGPIFAMIRLYEYRLTPYILMTEPEINATDAIKISKERTQGYKLKMWAADILLPVCIFVIALVLGLLSEIPVLGILFGLALFVFIVCAVALYPLYRGLIQAAFYEEIKNPTIVAPAQIPETILPAGGNYCPNCGTPLTPDSKFCPNCGNKLDS